MGVTVALDPGKATGVAVLQDDVNNEGFDSFELDFDATCRFVLQMATEHKSDLTLVSESFIITVNTAKNTAAPWSLELIGVFRMVSRLYLGRDLVLQTPVNAKRFSSDERLKHMGWHKKGKGHANDAARHLLYRQASTSRLPQDVLVGMAVTG